MLQKLLISKLDEYCPLQTFKLSSQDKPYMTFQLKKLHRIKQRVYLKRGKTEKYDKLAAEFKQKLDAAAEKFLKNKMDSLKETQPGKAYKILKDMGAQPGDCTDSHTFTLPNHQVENLSVKQCAERIANHFASISQEYKPLDLNLLFAVPHIPLLQNIVIPI